MNFFPLFFTALPIALAVDLVWIGLVANKFYSSQLGDLFSPTVQWVPAVIFYVIFIAAVTFFVIQPAVQANSWVQALLWGAFFGLAAYATYDLTNLAVIRDWPLFMSIVDIAWGTFFTAGISTATYFIATTFFTR
ncbi:DUF2177 family protein [Patescibacteria group bacterium]|nr:DUF2177 family protein [Patescibacteria group bacterium]MBU1754689.1 DUF2177 family protein [Patescibacteria group bacterium]